MTMRFTVLASGSAGNASLVQVDGFGVLLDAGLGPRKLTDRLVAAGASWRDIHALVLTHTHSDHWNERTLGHLLRYRVPVYCHATQQFALQQYSRTFALMHSVKLVNTYVAGEALPLAAGLTCRPLPVCHDGGPTFGFRFDGRSDLFGNATSLAYLADLGCWDHALIEAATDVDLLALEFNHDVEMEHRSGRMPRLIARVLGDEGHLSNEQAAGFLGEVLRRTRSGRLRHVVQLHLSRDCNHPDLAALAARRILLEYGSTAAVHTARQDTVSPAFRLGPTVSPRPRSATRRPRRPVLFAQPWLPGLEIA